MAVLLLGDTSIGLLNVHPSRLCFRLVSWMSSHVNCTACTEGYVEHLVGTERRQQPLADCVAT